jgi:hypothetical protein
VYGFGGPDAYRALQKMHELTNHTRDGFEEERRSIMRKAMAKKTVRFHDKRRKHRHWQVTVFYHDGEKFARVYIDRNRAEHFAIRQKKSPVVKATRILEVD